MHKKHLILIAALFAVAFCGCKKRETIDLGSLHTTVATEKETMPETSSESTSQDTDASADDSAAGSNASALKTELKKETSGTAEIEYPVIANMKDKEKQDQVNTLLKANAMAAADAYPEQTLSIQATVESINLRRITVSYKGERKSGSTAERVFFTNTVDLETGKNLGLSDFADAYTVAGYIVSGDYRLTDSAAAETAVRSAISSSASTIEAYYKKLQAADFTGSASSWPEIFSYEKQGVVYVSLPVSAELGNYVLIHYSPDNK